MHILPRAKSLPWAPLVIVLALLVLCVSPSPAAADEGYATWYGQPFHGRHMYNGQIFDMYDPTTTACNIYPLGTWIKVTNPANGHTAIVQVRDRGGFSHALDLSYAAFAMLDNPAKMGIHVQYQVVSGPDAVVPPPDKPQPTPTPAPPAPSAPPQPAPAEPPAEYTVAPGDSLSGLAERFGLDVVKLMRWNNLDDADWLVAGQRLALRAPQVVAPSSRSAEGGTYVVAEGDTLWDVATKYGTTPATLAELNGVGDDGVILVGQTLRLPAGANGAGSGGGARRYVVQEGDTLLGIALNAGVDVDTIMRLTGLDDSDLIVVDQVLYLP
jgi:LysM repeat protein